MSGGTWEYVMANQSSGSESYSYYKSNAGSNFSYSTTTAKYVDMYANGSSLGDQIAMNRARLGDATGEVTSIEHYTWYDDYAYFVYSSNPWFYRGGGLGNGTGAGMYYYSYSDGGALDYTTARTALVQ